MDDAALGFATVSESSTVLKIGVFRGNNGNFTCAAQPNLRLNSNKYA